MPKLAIQLKEGERFLYKGMLTGYGTLLGHIIAVDKGFGIVSVIAQGYLYEARAAQIERVVWGSTAPHDHDFIRPIGHGRGTIEI